MEKKEHRGIYKQYLFKAFKWNMVFIFCQKRKNRKLKDKCNTRETSHKWVYTVCNWSGYLHFNGY